MLPQEIEYIFDRSCLRKKQLTEEIANKIVDQQLNEEGRLMYFYKCPFCSSFHLTSKIPYEETRLKVI